MMPGFMKPVSWVGLEGRMGVFLMGFMKPMTRWREWGPHRHHEAREGSRAGLGFMGFMKPWRGEWARGGGGGEASLAS